MNLFSTLMQDYGGTLFTVIGAFLAVFLAGTASAQATGMVGEAAAGIISEEPEKFGQALVLQLLPGTQGLYGFIVGFLALLKLTTPITLGQGFYLFLACLPAAIVGYTSAFAQARVCVAGLQILVKNPQESTKGVIFAAIVETYAILGFVASIIMLFVSYPA